MAESFGHEAGNSGNWVMHPVIDVERVDLTGEVLFVVDATTIAADLEGRMWIIAYDGHGRYQASLPLTGNESLRYDARLVDMMTGEGPYTFRLVADTSTAGRVEVMTEPPLGELSLAAGEEVQLELEAIGFDQ